MNEVDSIPGLVLVEPKKKPRMLTPVFHYYVTFLVAPQSALCVKVVVQVASQSQPASSQRKGGVLLTGSSTLWK